MIGAENKILIPDNKKASLNSEMVDCKLINCVHFERMLCGGHFSLTKI
jgi:hypothetical protein